jgi:hypothetical protein
MRAEHGIARTFWQNQFSTDSPDMVNGVLNGKTYGSV